MELPLNKSKNSLKNPQEKAILISGTHCGVGKTTVSFILMALLKQMGYQVQPFKNKINYT